MSDVLYVRNEKLEEKIPALQETQKLIPGLRGMLDKFRKDDWPYSPHVTTDKHDSISDPLTRFCFMRGTKILGEWSVQ